MSTSQSLPPSSGMVPPGGGPGGSDGYGRQMSSRMPMSGVQGRTPQVVGAFSLPSPQGKGRGGNRGMGASHPGLSSQQFHHEHQLQQREQPQGYGGGGAQQPQLQVRHEASISVHCTRL